MEKLVLLSYFIMRDCWQYKPENRPNFKEIKDKLEWINEKESNKNYIQHLSIYSISFFNCRSILMLDLILQLLLNFKEQNNMLHDIHYILN